MLSCWYDRSVQALRKVKVNNPVFLLDEIDKLTSGAGFHGDPSAAMVRSKHYQLAECRL